MADIFPIIRTIVYNGQDYKKRLDEGDEVKCWFCSDKFKLTWRTVHVASDGMQMVHCPKCRRNVSVLYYFDNANKKTVETPKHKKNHRSTRIYHHALKEVS